LDFCLGFAYPSSSTSPFDLPSLYPPTPSPSIPCSSSSFLLSDSTAYYSNSYYPPTSSYYFPYGTTPSSSTHYPFITPFNYSLNNNSNLESTSFLHMQPPMTISSNDNNHLTPLLPITTDTEEY